MPKKCMKILQFAVSMANLKNLAKKTNVAGSG
jgi:hypothetical protein